MPRVLTFKQEVFDTICSLMAEGRTLREIGRMPGMPGESTVRMWVAREVTDGIRAQYAHAREALAEHWADEILEAADDGTNDWMERRLKDGTVEAALDREHIQRSALRVDARKWLLSKILPKSYGDKVKVEHDGKIDIGSMSEAEIDDRIGRLLAQGGTPGTSGGAGEA